MTQPFQAGVMLGTTLLAAACTRPYVIDDFASTYQARAQVVALAPLANRTTVADAPAELWEAIYLELRNGEPDFTAKMQRENETQGRIRDAGVRPGVAALLPPGELCRILGADAVITGTVTGFIQYPVAQQAQVAMAYGDATGSEVLVDLQITDCASGELVWGFKVKKAGGFRTSPAGLRERVGAEVAERFPYRRD